jgi:hypothetical protein
MDFARKKSDPKSMLESKLIYFYDFVLGACILGLILFFAFILCA